MNKAQGELSTNTIVIGAIALIVLIILAGLIFTRALGVEDLVTALRPQAQSVSYTGLVSDCYSICRTIERITDFDYRFMTQDDMEKIIRFCCYGGDYDGDGMVGDEEICAHVYQDCIVGGFAPKVFCKGVVNVEGLPEPIPYDFTIVRDYNRVGCGGSAYCTGKLCLCCEDFGEAAIIFSCPFVYSITNNESHLEHEGYALAVVKEWEYTSYETMQYLEPVNDSLIIELREELPETSYTNELKLYKVVHSEDELVFPDNNGLIHAVNNFNNYESLSVSVEDYTESRIFTFKNSAGSPKLLIEAKEAGLVRDTGYELLNMIGENNMDFFYKLLSFEPFKTLFYNIKNELVSSEISVLVGDEWVSIERFGVGGAKWNKVFFSLPETESEYYTVRVSNVLNAYKYKTVMLGFSDDNALIVEELKSTDAPYELLSIDDDYLILKQGESVRLTYEYSPCTGSACSYVLSITGYYHVEPPNIMRELTLGLFAKLLDYLFNPEKLLILAMQ